MDKIQKDQKPNCYFWGARNENRMLKVEAGYWACPLHSTPSKGWADHLSHPSSLTPGCSPTLTPCKEPTHPLQGFLFLFPTAVAGAQIKLCLNFLHSLLSNSIDWGRPRALEKGRVAARSSIEYHQCRLSVFWFKTTWLKGTQGCHYGMSIKVTGLPDSHLG